MPSFNVELRSVQTIALHLVKQVEAKDEDDAYEIARAHVENGDWDDGWDWGNYSCLDGEGDEIVAIEEVETPKRAWTPTVIQGRVA